MITASAEDRRGPGESSATLIHVAIAVFSGAPSQAGAGFARGS
jgi:hypothetical protein